MSKSDVGPLAVADCGTMKLSMEARFRADLFSYLGSGHNIKYLCVNLFTLRRFNNNESSGGRQILLPLLGGDAPRLG